MRFLVVFLLMLFQLPLHAEEAKQPRNAILFLGDGMGISTVTAARIYAGQLEGGSGEEYELSWDRFPHVALVKTYNVDRQVPDSAGTISAILTGKPGRFTVLSVDPSIEAEDCAGSLGHALPTLLERAEQAGLATGIVSTARLTHATPAANYAHSPSRGWESDVNLPEEARAAGCRDIARQFVEFTHGDGIEVALAGGRGQFLPATESDPEYPGLSGLRGDGRNLVQEWLAGDPERRFVWNQEQFSALPSDRGGHVLGLFEPSHMQFEIDRVREGGSEPDLVQLTEFAIRRLQASERGFFLMVEGGRIDHAHHDGNAARALSETVMMHRAVARALELTDPANTQVMVTADHSHTLTIAGYPERGNPILGVNKPNGEGMLQDLFGRPYTTLGYANGPGYLPQLPDLSNVDTTDPDYRQYAGWPMAGETHGGEDVGAWANGLGAEKLHGVIEQKKLHDVLSFALFGE